MENSGNEDGNTNENVEVPNEPEQNFIDVKEVFGDNVELVLNFNPEVIGHELKDNIVKLAPKKEGKTALVALTKSENGFSSIYGKYVLIDVDKDLNYKINQVSKIPTDYKMKMPYEFKSLDQSGINYYYEGVNSPATEAEKISVSNSSFKYTLEELNDKEILTIVNISGQEDKYIVENVEQEIAIETTAYKASLNNYIDIFLSDFNFPVKGYNLKTEGYTATTLMHQPYSDRLRLSFSESGVHYIYIFEEKNKYITLKFQVVEYQGYYGTLIKQVN